MPDTVRQHHNVRLVSGMRRQLWVGDYDGAAAAADAIHHHGVASPVPFRVMLEALRRGHDTHRHCVRLFRTLVGKTVLPPQAVLLEFACYLIARGDLQEAFDNLAGYVNRAPYKYNALLHGYYGMLAFAIWQEAEVSNTASKATQQLVKIAEQHLRQARTYDPTC